MKPNIEYFSQLLSLKYSKKFSDPVTNSGWLESDLVQDYFANYVESCLEDDTFFVEHFQSVFNIRTALYTIEDLIAASPLTMQNALQARSIEQIWSHSNTGLVTNEQLLKPINVVVQPNGKLLLFGGNHRLAGMLLPFVVMDRLEDALPVQIKCLEYTIDYDALRLHASNYDEELAEEMPEDAVIAFANKFMVQLWESDNQSRKMQSSEVAGAKLFERGVDRTDNDALLDALFEREKGEAKLLNARECMTWVSANLFNENDDLEYAVDDEGNRLYDASKMSRAISIPAISTDELLPISRKSFEQIVGSFYTALAAHHTEIQTTTKDGTPKTKKVKLYSKDLADREVFTEICETITQSDDPMIATAINQFIQEQPEENEMRFNVAYNATKIGKKLCELYVNVADPVHDVMAKQAKATPAPSPRRYSIGLNL